MPEESGEEVIVFRVGAQLQELGLPRVLNFKRESYEHLRRTHLEKEQHCTDLSRQVTFPAHTDQEKMGPGLG